MLGNLIAILLAVSAVNASPLGTSGVQPNLSKRVSSPKHQATAVVPVNYITKDIVVQVLYNKPSCKQATEIRISLPGSCSKRSMAGFPDFAKLTCDPRLQTITAQPFPSSKNCVSNSAIGNPRSIKQLSCMPNGNSNSSTSYFCHNFASTNCTTPILLAVSDVNNITWSCPPVKSTKALTSKTQAPKAKTTSYALSVKTKAATKPYALSLAPLPTGKPTGAAPCPSNSTGKVGGDSTAPTKTIPSYVKPTITYNPITIKSPAGSTDCDNKNDGIKTSTVTPTSIPTSIPTATPTSDVISTVLPTLPPSSLVSVSSTGDISSANALISSAVVYFFIVVSFVLVL